MSGNDQSWVLPEVNIGSAALVVVEVIPDLYLAGLIDYDAETRTVSFSDTGASKRLQEGYYKIKINLIDENNLKTEYTWQLIVEKLISLEPEKEENPIDTGEDQKDP